MKFGLLFKPKTKTIVVGKVLGKDSELRAKKAGATVIDAPSEAKAIDLFKRRIQYQNRKKKKSKVFAPF